MIGVANRGAANLAGVAGEEIVALCDVDPAHAEAARMQFPQARFFTDARKLFDAVGQKVDGVVVSTPDHTHSPSVVRALSLKKHLYCEKPLARSVGEVRMIRASAKKAGTVTQMGTQIHAGDNYRRVVEFVQSGRLGEVSKVDVWLAGGPTPAKKINPPFVGVRFNTDTWLGPVPTEFFYTNLPKWPHFNWRQWWAFGGGALADFGCHFLDLPFWALGLTAPQTIESTGTPMPDADNAVPGVQDVTWVFARAGKPDLTLTWHHGSKPARAYPGFPSSVAFHTPNGILVSDYSKHKLFDAKGEIAPPERSIPKSLGHHAEWLSAIRGVGQTLCPIEYAGPLTEAVLLGNVAYRAGSKVTWDAAAGKASEAAAQALVNPPLREGWLWASKNPCTDVPGSPTGTDPRDSV